MSQFPIRLLISLVVESRVKTKILHKTETSISGVASSHISAVRQFSSMSLVVLFLFMTWILGGVYFDRVSLLKYAALR